MGFFDFMDSMLSTLRLQIEDPPLSGDLIPITKCIGTLGFQTFRLRKMITYHNTESPTPVAEVARGTAVINSASDILNIFGSINIENCSRIIIHADSFNDEFFDLRTGVAGEIFQKFSNYRMSLSVVGDLSHLTSRSWRDFIRESNRGKTVNFHPTLEEALTALTK